MVKLVNRQVPGLPIVPWATGKPSCIVLHDTANDSDNGKYEGERNYMANHWQNAFYHLIAGEADVAILHDPAKGGAWGAGPSMHHYAIHIELVHSNNKAGFLKAYNNWLDAAVYYMKKYNIPLMFDQGNSKRGVYSHDYVRKTWGGTTHTDPWGYVGRWGITPAQLKKDLTAKFNGKDIAQSAKPKEEIPLAKVKEFETKIASLEKQLKTALNAIDTMSKQMATALKKKEDVPSASQTVDPSHKEGWEFLQGLKVTDGRNPHNHATREQIGTMFHKYDKARFFPQYDLLDHEKGSIPWVQENKVSDGSRPHEFARRGEVMTMLKNFSEYLNTQNAKVQPMSLKTPLEDEQPKTDEK